MDRSVWVLWILSAFFAVLGQAETKCYEGYEHCDLKLFPYAYFHAVTCRGFARVAMNVTDVDTMNKKIDTLLEKAKEEHKENPCLTVKTFYYNVTSLIFLKYDLDGDDMAYWITGQLAYENEFIPFPAADKWISLRRKGYSEEVFNSLNQEEKMKSVCDPEMTIYNMYTKQFFVFGGAIDLKAYSDFESVMISLEEDGSCNTAGHNPPRLDPFGDNLGGWGMSGDRRDVFLNQLFDGYSVITKRSATNNKQYIALFQHVKQLGIYCFLREYRHDLDELPQLYMIPKSGDYKLFVKECESPHRGDLTTEEQCSRAPPRITPGCWYRKVTPTESPSAIVFLNTTIEKPVPTYPMKISPTESPSTSRLFNTTSEKPTPTYPVKISPNESLPASALLDTATKKPLPTYAVIKTRVAGPLNNTKNEAVSLGLTVLSFVVVRMMFG
ncbi:hypothetical protein QR680_006581 [Steinernema hermaphroditum]|uniref:Uncharacterized protein n=1 Tax=Steinernema hermaphroditum TaxID=289476 RepID=A0AA39LWS5_9BILA|nr:hypothetical protein QR680_006581 [Steinernema hermaphroditum]